MDYLEVMVEAAMLLIVDERASVKRAELGHQVHLIW
jgi:hypothetical protein